METGTENLETKRLLLRPFVFEDAKAIYETYATDERVTRYLTWTPHPNIETTIAFVKNKLPRYAQRDYFDWAVTLKENGQLIGGIDVVDNEKISKTKVIGYCYGFDYWNKGYATEAFKKVIEYLFEKQDTEVIIAKYVSTNYGSENVMKKCHMRKVKNWEEIVYSPIAQSKETCYLRKITKKQYFQLKGKGEF